MRGQRGYVIQIVLITFAIIIGLLIFPVKFPELKPELQTGNNGYCHEFITGDSHQITVPSNGKKYRLIKAKVPVLADYYKTEGNSYNHFGAKEEFTDPEDSKKYIIRHLGEGGSGASYQFASDLDPNRPYDLAFQPYGLIMLFEADDNFEPIDPKLEVDFWAGNDFPLLLADIYKEEGTPPLPEWVLKCQDFPTERATESLMHAAQNSSAVVPIQGTGVFVPDQNKSPDSKQLQLEWFLFNSQKFLVHNWWVPHCKPAVYLYPEKKQLVNVKVFPKGELGFTDPVYDPKEGWTVNANPDGSMSTSANEIIRNGYLYYESRIRDEEIRKPEKGWVVKYEELANFYDQTLPKLGLNSKEAKDFSEYWLKALPKSPYYFVGLVDKPQRDYLELLRVTPEPDTSIRFSFFFEPVDQPENVEAPVIVTPQRKGFTLVDWGGMIKLHPGTPFTCSQ